MMTDKPSTDDTTRSTPAAAVTLERLLDLVTQVWTGMLELGIECIDEADRWVPERWLTGCIQFTGTWAGTLVLECSADLGRRVASVMFGVDLDAVTPGEMLDAIGEMTNVLGGNLKSLLAVPCQLSLPSIVEGGPGTVSVLGGRRHCRMHLASVGEPAIVTMWERQS